MRSSRLTGLVLAAALASVAGCGGDDDAGKADSSTTGTQGSTATVPRITTNATTPLSETAKNDPAPGRTVQAFYNAMSVRNGDAACTHLTRALRQTAIQLIRKSAGGAAIKTCGAALEAGVRRNSAAQLRMLRDVKVLSSTVDGGLATVRVERAPNDALLTRERGRWIISSGVFRTAG